MFMIEHGLELPPDIDKNDTNEDIILNLNPDNVDSSTFMPHVPSLKIFRHFMTAIKLLKDINLYSLKLTPVFKL